MLPAELNITLFQWINTGAGQRPIVDGIAVFCAESGPYILVVLFLILWFFVGKDKKSALLEATQAVIIGLALNQLIGLFYVHPRPFMVGLCIPLFPHVVENSFPSDHVTLMCTAAFYLLIARGWIACALPLLLFTLFTAWGRIYSGIHFPFDMAGSLMVGLISTGFMAWLAKSISPWNMKLILVYDQIMIYILKLKKNV